MFVPAVLLEIRKDSSVAWSACTEADISKSIGILAKKNNVSESQVHVV